MLHNSKDCCHDGDGMNFEKLDISELNMSVRTTNALRREGIMTAGTLMLCTEEFLLSVRNMGRKSVDEALSMITRLKSGEFSIEGLGQAIEVDNGEKVLGCLRENEIAIETLDKLSLKAYNCLLFGGFRYLHEIIPMSDEELLQLPRMTEESLCEIRSACNEITDRYLKTIASMQQNEATQKVQGNSVPIMELIRYPNHAEETMLYVKAHDIPVSELNLTNTLANKLLRNGISVLSQMVLLNEVQLKEKCSLSDNHANILWSRICGYVQEHERNLRALLSGNRSVMYTDGAVMNKILRLYDSAPFGGLSLQDVATGLDIEEYVNQERLKKLLGRMIAMGKLEYVDYRCYRIYPRFADVLEICDNVSDRNKEIIRKRLAGNTLEEVGQSFNLTRERVRQIVNRDVSKVREKNAASNGVAFFDEDYYRYLYENYSVDKSDAVEWLGLSEFVWGYLDTCCEHSGDQALENAQTDAKIDAGLRLKIRNYLNRGKLFYRGKWVEKKRSVLENLAVKELCADEIPFDEYFEKFNGFLEELEIPYDEKLYYTEDVRYTRKNRLSESRSVLWGLNERMRYYNIDDTDFSVLLDVLGLDAYENVEVTTIKLFELYPELMEKYDIRNYNELHNLLKKIIPEGDYHNIHFGRMPNIRFGEFDRDAAMLDILLSNAPITPYDLAQIAHEEYGYDPLTTQANYLGCLSPYYHKGIYTIDQKAMTYDRMESLKKALQEDFYFLDEVKHTYKQLFPDGDLEEINPYNLKIMGFSVYCRYVLQNYPSLEVYFEHLLTEQEIVDITPYRKRYGYVVSFTSKVIEMRRELRIVEFEPNKIVSFSRLERMGVTKADVKAFCQAVCDFAETDTFFTIASIRNAGFDSVLFDLGFSDWFYANLLLSDLRFSNGKMLGTIVFRKDDTLITMKDFMFACLIESGNIDCYDFVNEVNVHYGTAITDHWDVIHELKKAGAYYDANFGRIYLSDDAFYQELDEMGAY